MASQKISSGKSLSTLDVNLDVRQDTPSKLQVETTPATTPITNLQQINGTGLTSADWTLLFQSLFNSLGSAGISPVNTSGKTMLQLLTDISTRTSQTPVVTSTLLIASDEVLTAGLNEDISFRDITNEGVILIDGTLNVFGTAKNNGTSYDNGIVHNNGTMRVS